MVVHPDLGDVDIHCIHVVADKALVLVTRFHVGECAGATEEGIERRTVAGAAIGHAIAAVSWGVTAERLFAKFAVELAAGEIAHHELHLEITERALYRGDGDRLLQRDAGIAAQGEGGAVDVVAIHEALVDGEAGGFAAAGSTTAWRADGEAFKTAFGGVGDGGGLAGIGVELENLAGQ